MWEPRLQYNDPTIYLIIYFLNINPATLYGVFVLGSSCNVTGDRALWIQHSSKGQGKVLYQF